MRVVAREGFHCTTTYQPRISFNINPLLLTIWFVEKQFRTYVTKLSFNMANCTASYVSQDGTCFGLFCYYF